MIKSLCADIIEAHRRRRFAMGQAQRLNLALLAHLRLTLGWSMALPEAERAKIRAQAQRLIKAPSGEFTEVVYATELAAQPFMAIRKMMEKDLAQMAILLPVWAVFEPVRGFGPLSLATIVGEAGDLGGYASHSKLWKRMGLAVIGGYRQGRPPGSPSKEEWIAHGYSPQRRSFMWNIGEALVKQGEFYRQVYLERKIYECARAEALGLEVRPAAKIKKAEAGDCMSQGHVHNRAKRYMEKRLLRDLWLAWRRAILVKPQKAMIDVPAAEIEARP